MPVPEFRIVVAEAFPAFALDRLRQQGTLIILEQSAPDALIAAIKDAHALLVRGKTHVTARILDAANELKVIGRAATSVDHIDLRVAARRNVIVVYSPQAGVQSLAEFTIAMILAAQRRLLHFDRRVRSGEFETLRDYASRDLRHHTIGLLGMSRVADEVGRVMSATFGCPLIYHDPAGRTPRLCRADSVSLEALFERSDVLSLHLALDMTTRHIVNETVIRRMPANAILVNTSRGPLVEPTSLADALKSGRIRGAAIDVFDTEPLPAEHPLRTAPNCILTPHIGSLTIDARDALYNVVDDVVRVLRGEPPLFPASVDSNASQDAKS